MEGFTIFYIERLSIFKMLTLLKLIYKSKEIPLKTVISLVEINKLIIKFICEQGQVKKDERGQQSGRSNSLEWPLNYTTCYQDKTSVNKSEGLSEG